MTRHTPAKQADADTLSMPPDQTLRLEQQRFPVVGVGSSAGGLEAILRFLSALPAGCGLAIVLVPHLDPNHKSLMVELLAEKTPLPVTEVTDDCTIEVNHIYVIPPGHFLTVTSGHLKLSPIPPQPRTAIDPFLMSLADDLGERSVGIILSGTGSHGSRGIKQIKLKGGRVLAQAPDTTDFDQMPRNAIATGAVDSVLAPERMADDLINYSLLTSRYGNTDQLVNNEATQEPLDKILALLQQETQLDYSLYRKNMVLRRIFRRMRLVSSVHLEDYLQLLLDTPAELAALHQDLLINVSAFFREPKALEVLTERVLPELVARCDPEHPIRIWIPGCAAGEEALTITMLVLEQFAAANKPPSLQVFATDIDDNIIQRCRRGCYPAGIALELSAERLQRYFTQQPDTSYRVCESLRQYILYAPQNLVSDPPFSQLDLISCQNLFIYLEPEIQQQVIALFHFGLKDQGYLILGPSESIRGENQLFQPISRKWRIFKRLNIAHHRLANLPLTLDTIKKTALHSSSQTPSQGNNMSHLMHAILLAQHTPASVLIDRHGEALCFHGQTSDYLEIPDGQPTQNLLAMTRQGVRTRLRTAIRQALIDQREVIYEDARVVRNGQYFPCTLRVSPVSDSTNQRDLLLVCFTDRPRPTTPMLAADEISDDSLIQQLEHELKVTHEELHTNIEALELSNEELKASNEEAMSMNEEMQSANEELETSGEELRSVNEELINANNQLQEKIAELEQSNNDISNLLSSSDIGTLFLDTRLHIKLFTPPMQALLTLLDQDIGRPLADFCLRFDDQRLLHDCRQVLEQLTAMERVVVADSGRSYLRRIRPYRTQDDRIDGVVITFVDISERIQADAETRRLAQVLQDSNDAVIVQDLNGNITDWNRGATQLYGYSESEMLGSAFSKLLPGNKADRAVSLFDDLLNDGEGYSVESPRLHRDGHRLTVWLTATRLLDGSGGMQAIATTERDISQQKQLEHELKSLNKTLEKRVDQRTSALKRAASQLTVMYSTAPVGLCVLDNQLKFKNINSRLIEYLSSKQEADAIKGQRLLDVAPELGDQLRPLIQRVLDHGDPISDHEILINDPNSKPRTYLCYCQAIAQQQEPLAGVTVALQDITQRKATEQALKEKEQRVTTILNTAVDAIVSINGSGLIEVFNPAAEQMFGYAAVEAIGRNIDLLMPSPHRDRHHAYLAHYESDNRRSTVVGTSQDLVAVRKDGTTFPISLSVGEVDHRHGYTGIIRDLSQQRALQNQLLSIAEQAQREIGQALHDDIGQEMTGLALKAETLSLKLQDIGNIEQEFIANIIAGLDRTRKKIRILSHGLIPVAIDANGLNHALKALTQEVTESYNIECSFSASPDTELNDPDVATQLYHIAQEAIGNAMRHSQGDHIQVQLNRESRGLTLTIEDDGLGIPDDALQGTGSGFNIMQYRASMIDAQLTMKPSRSGGLRVICCLRNGEHHATSGLKEDTHPL